MTDLTLRMLLLGDDRGASASLDDVGKAAESTGDKLENVGDESGREMADGIGKFAKVAVGAFAGLVASAGTFAAALDFSAGTSKVTAQLGLTKAESATVGKVSGSLFSQGYGTGMEQVQEAIHATIQDIDGMRTASEKTLERIAGKVTNVANIFDQDLGGVTRAVSQMMRTGLAQSADEALDIITKGFQSGVDKSDDFLDTINEYGTQFRKMGLSGQMATGLLSQGLKAGARDADIVADAIKEFSLRTQGSLEQTDSKGRVHLTALGSAFQQVLPKGVDMYKMQENLAKGGARGRQGLDTMLDGLRGITDPLTRSQVAVQLFGTQAEDMGAALYALDPSKAVAALGKVKGAADEAGNAFNDNAKAKLSTFWRGLEAGAIEIVANKVIPALEKLAPVVEGVFGFIDQHTRTVVGFGIAIGAATVLVQAHTVAMAIAAAGGLLPYLSATKLVTTATKVWSAGQWLLNAALTANPIGLVIVAIAALVAGVILAYKHSETFRKIVDTAFHAIATAGKWMWDNVLKPAFSNMVAGLQAIGRAGTWLWNNALQPAFRLIVGGVAALLEMWARMLGALARVPGFGWAKGAADAMHNAAQRAADMADGIRKIPNSKNTDVSTTGVGAASSAVANYRRLLDNLPAYVRTQIVTQHTDKFERIAARAGGGPITAGRPYLVGENGPELIVPDTSGMVVNADGTQRLGAGGRGPGGAGDADDPGYVVVVVQTEDGREIHRKLLKVKRENGGVALGIG